MNLKQLFSRRTISYLHRSNGRLLSQHPYSQRDLHSLAWLPSVSAPCRPESSCPPNPKFPRSIFLDHKYIHSAQEARLSDSEDAEENDEVMNEFLSRFVWIMRGKLNEVYPDTDKQTIDGMLLVIVEKVVDEMNKGGMEKMLLGAATTSPSNEFSEDLWKTVWEASNKVLEDMEKERRKEKMKSFFQAEEVKEMCRFAGEVGIRGDMLRELRYKWAREKMEEAEFYESLEKLRKEAEAREKEDNVTRERTEAIGEEAVVSEEKVKVVSLPKRHGKFKYKIYGLDLSSIKWAEVADKVHEVNKDLWPQEPKPISGKCKCVTEKILSLKEQDDPSPLLSEWMELQQPSRIDWISLLDSLKEKNTPLYYKVAELLLDEDSFQTNVRDYSNLIDAYARENHLEDAEQILKKMNEKGVMPDILTNTILVDMYIKGGNLDRAKETFESLRGQGFRPDVKAYTSMIMAYVNAGQPKMGESLMREMEARDLKPTEEIYMALLKSFAQLGDVGGAGRMATTMQFAGFQTSTESCSALVQAYGIAGEPDQARVNFDYMIKIGHKPDDQCTASMIAAYGKKNMLDRALHLLLMLEKDGFKPGIHTYTVLVDWFGKLQLIDEAEQVLKKIAELGEAPPFKIHVSLCDMYARAGMEKKALETLGVLEAKKEQLGSEDLETIKDALVDGGFMQAAQRVRGLMEARGFVPASRTFGRNR